MGHRLATLPGRGAARGRSADRERRAAAHLVQEAGSANADRAPRLGGLARRGRVGGARKENTAHALGVFERLEYGTKLLSDVALAERAADGEGARSGSVEHEESARHSV